MDVEKELERWVSLSLYVSGVIMGRVVEMVTEFEFLEEFLNVVDEIRPV